MNKLIITLGIVSLFLSTGALATENRYQQFSGDTEKAYSAYRVALFQTTKKNGEKSAKAIETFLHQWKQIEKTYGPQPPEIFSTDPMWDSTLAKIEAIATRSAEQVAENHLTEAHETLEAIRDELSDLRRRNSVIAFSDHINNYHEVMEGLVEGGWSSDPIDTDAIKDISNQLAVLLYLAEVIKDNAPDNYNDNKKYQQLRDGLLASLKSLQGALEEGDPDKIGKSIKMLKPAYAKLFVNFG